MADGIQEYVICAIQVEGFHCWPGAPADLSFLKARHRHVFHIRIIFKVSHGDREIEIIKQQSEIERWLCNKFGAPCEFGSMSCEDIAEELLLRFGAASCEVLEDGYGGARVVRQ